MYLHMSVYSENISVYISQIDVQTELFQKCPCNVNN